MAIRAPITPEVMKWARETARLSISVAAKKIHRTEDELRAWEDGSLKPTMPQARNAAEVYKRPLAVFYLPEPPRGWQVLRDFRTLPAEREREYSSELAYLVRETQCRQEWMRDYLEDEGYEPLSFVGSKTSASAPAEVAQEIRNTLKIATDAVRRCSSRREALNLWLECAEKAGVFVSRDSRIDFEEARGFVLCDDYAPFVFVNSKDAKVAQIFTLAHELTHLWVNQPGISNLGTMGLPPDTANAQVEVFCNQVAGLVLLQPAEFNQRWSSQSSSLPIEERIERVSSYFLVSRESVARRLLDKDIIVQAQYQELRERYREEWIEQREEKRRRQKAANKKPRVDPNLMRVIRNGRSFTQTVLGAYYGGGISGREASGLLGAKLNNFGKIADKAGFFVSTAGKVVAP